MHCAVLGDPIAHSLSPVLHRAAYVVLGLDWHYDAVRVPSGGLADFVATLDDRWRGLSLTMPLKREVLALGDTVAPRARLAGAANTVVLDGGRLHLDNTDLPGAAAAVREVWDGPVRSAVVLGAGATAASVGLALCDLGATSVLLLARSPERAAATVAVIAAHAAGPTVTVGGLDDDVGHAPPLAADVVVSTVPVAAQTPGLVRRCADVPVTFEALYDPWPTPLAAAALADDRVLVGGLDLLVHQAVLQVGLFTGLDAGPGLLAAMRAAGAAALGARTS